ncbi:hypothetical protein M422DRAFT_273109 [Sphaerobolus stellatus SS14]|uniref:Zn(2)-C6 fungal-type domain-containing protein n=1 Tax=Sphaerobolus stellatus (strain SS14) TaxID=990650 RepID=A0A0C9TA02_SPHS4|nr:hypothetical protein M422DRAFT_273109 [Sphaerobolus stellatus SS14]
MTDLELPAHMLAWKASTDMKCMEEIPVGDPRRTVRGFEPDKKFDGPAPKLSFDNPYEDKEDHLNKKSLILYRCPDAGEQVAAAVKRKAEEAAWAQSKAQDDEAREKEKEKEKEAGPSNQAKGKAREMPRTPKKITPKKSQHEVRSESEEDEDEDKPQSCIYCMRKKIQCVPQAGKKVCVACGQHKMKCEFFDKTAWAVMEGSKQMVESVWELAGLERRWDAGRLKVIWHDHQRFMIEIEQWAAADARVLKLLELKSKGVEIPEDLEKRICTERDLVQGTHMEQLEDLTRRMDNIQKCTAWTKNGLPRLNPEVPPVAAQGIKRKGDNEGDRMEGGKKKKKKKVVETEEEESIMQWGVIGSGWKM